MEGVSRGQSRVYWKHPASGLVCHFSPAALDQSGQSVLGTVALFRDVDSCQKVDYSGSGWTSKPCRELSFLHVLS